MGRGAEKQVKSKDKTLRKKAVDTSKLSLAHMSDDELQRWAALYGVKAEMTRDELLVEMEPYAAGILDKDAPLPLPLEPPSITLKDLKDAIPAHCFKRSFFKGMMHVFSDLAIAGLLFYGSLFIDHPAVPTWARYVLWPIYWYAQGTVLTGVWVLAHECGHQSFSENEIANNIVGTILHSFLLVPYHSWRITHGLHHNNTGSCENDEVFAPATRSDFTSEMLSESPLWYAFVTVRMLTVGWIPGYLVFNASGPKKYRGKNASHFSPGAAMFKDEERELVAQSVSAWVAMVAVIAYWVYTYGAYKVMMHYFIPYLIVNYHLVLITYLQHTDTFVPHFRNKEWNWLRGALCTVDRSFGPVMDYCFHHIADTHVCHHLFSKMPFYHAQEATEHIREVLGKYYLKDETPIARALWRSIRNCQFVEDAGDVVFYKNKL